MNGWQQSQDPGLDLGAQIELDRQRLPESTRQELDAALRGDRPSLKVIHCAILPELARARADDLRELALWHPGDSDLTHLAAFRGLTKLDLHEADGITDGGLPAIAAIVGLRELLLPTPQTNSRLTHAAVAALRKSLPQCVISGGPPEPPPPWWRFW